MSKPLLGLLLGAALGFFDGLTAWMTPAVRPYMMTILIGSSVKGLIVGLAAGFFARKVKSIPMGVLFGFVCALAFAWWVASQPTDGQYYWAEIMIPGSIVGAIVGWATQRYGRAGRSAGTEAAAAAR
jgi:hypothetical protein